MKKLLILAVVLSALLSLWQVSLVSGQEPVDCVDYPCVELTKTGPETAVPGQKITYHFRVENCGNVPLLSGVQVYDPLLSQSADGLLWSLNLCPNPACYPCEHSFPHFREFYLSYTLPLDHCGEFTNEAWAESGCNCNVRDDASWTVNIVCPPGTGTPGYWMNHPEAWPVDEIEIGGVPYSKGDAIGYMMDPVKGDKTFTMFPALVAAKLNVLMGNDDSCIADTIAEADAWMEAYGPVGSGVEASSDAWQAGEPLYEELDEYNNGELDCVLSRDDFE